MGKQHFKLTAVEQLNITYQGNVPLEKRLRKALFILTLHSKLYADKKGVIELSDYDFMLINKGAIKENIKEDLSSSSLANVEVRMRDLEQLGKLVIVEHSGGDYKKPNKYRLLNNAEANSRIKELTVCSDSDVSLSRVIEIIRANTNGSSAYRKRTCSCFR